MEQPDDSKMSAPYEPELPRRLELQEEPQETTDALPRGSAVAHWETLFEEPGIPSLFVDYLGQELDKQHIEDEQVPEEQGEAAGCSLPAIKRDPHQPEGTLAPGEWLLPLFSRCRVGDVVSLPEPLYLSGQVYTSALVERDFRTASGALLLKFQPGEGSYIIKFSDVQQECAMMCALLEMNRRWREHNARVCNYPVEAVTYNIVPLGCNGGLVEAVLYCSTLRELRKECKSDSRERVLLSLNSDAEKLDRLAATTTAYLTACYALGVRDGHDDNIMLREDGSLFRVDFGFVFGATPEIDSPQTVVPRAITFALGQVRWIEVVAACGDALTALTGDSYGSPPALDCLRSVPEMGPYLARAEQHARTLSLAGFCQDVSCADQWSFARAAKNTLREAVQFLRDQAGLGPDDLSNKTCEQTVRTGSALATAAGAVQFLRDQAGFGAGETIDKGNNDCEFEDDRKSGVSETRKDSNDTLMDIGFLLEPGLAPSVYTHLSISAGVESTDNYANRSLFNDLAEMAGEDLVMDGREEFIAQEASPFEPAGKSPTCASHMRNLSVEIRQQVQKPEAKTKNLHMNPHTSARSRRSVAIPFPTQQPHLSQTLISDGSQQSRHQTTLEQRGASCVSEQQRRQQASCWIEQLQLHRYQQQQQQHLQQLQHHNQQHHYYQYQLQQQHLPPRQQLQQQQQLQYQMQHRLSQPKSTLQETLTTSRACFTWSDYPDPALNVSIPWPASSEQCVRPLPADDPFARTPPGSPKGSPKLLKVLTHNGMERTHRLPLQACEQIVHQPGQLPLQEVQQDLSQVDQHRTHQPIEAARQSPSPLQDGTCRRAWPWPARTGPSSICATQG